MVYKHLKSLNELLVYTSRSDAKKLNIFDLDKNLILVLESSTLICNFLSLQCGGDGLNLWGKVFLSTSPLPLICHFYPNRKDES